MIYLSHLKSQTHHQLHRAPQLLECFPGAIPEEDFVAKLESGLSFLDLSKVGHY